MNRPKVTLFLFYSRKITFNFFSCNRRFLCVPGICLCIVQIMLILCYPIQNVFYMCLGFLQIFSKICKLYRAQNLASCLNQWKVFLYKSNNSEGKDEGKDKPVVL